MDYIRINILNESLKSFSYGGNIAKEEYRNETNISIFLKHSFYFPSKTPESHTEKSLDKMFSKEINDLVNPVIEKYRKIIESKLRQEIHK